MLEKNSVLHIMKYDKFIADYVNKVNELFDNTKHTFFIWGQRENKNIKQVKGNNVIFSNSIKQLKELVKEKDKVILHSIIFPRELLIAISSLVPVYKDKFFWNIWGADLYDHYWERNNNLLSKIREIVRRRIIKNLKAVGAIPGDYKFLQEAYNVSPKRYVGLYTYSFDEIKEAKQSSTINVLIGNSANPYCQHLKTIDMLETYKDKDIKVYCVLSYPKDNMAYINKVIEYGKEKLGDKFIPLTDFLSYKDYMELLSDIDIAIFNNNRQQANGNIISLLYYGKTVFINPLNTFLAYYKEKGAIVYSTEEFSDKTFIKNKSIVENTELIKKLFSNEEFYKAWNIIFEDDYY